MKKSDLIESWLNSEISEDEAILILERMKHDDSFTKEMVSSGEIHAALYTIFHEDNSFEQLKLSEQSKSPEEIENQIMSLIAAGDPKEKEKKKRITVIDLPQHVTVQTKSFEKPKNYWPLFGAVAAILVLILSIAILTKKDEAPQETVEKNRSLSKDENISLVKDQRKKKPVTNTVPDKKPKTLVVKQPVETPKPEVKPLVEEKMLVAEKVVQQEEKKDIQVVVQNPEIGYIEGESEY
ncbi:MAG: hypothetical protein NE327_07955, partial [Lentisphaeraceae bacterium]|nr:hypothetical protein [Lentisphaeraceae bacterium]